MTDLPQVPVIPPDLEQSLEDLDVALAVRAARDAMAKVEGLHEAAERVRLLRAAKGKRVSLRTVEVLEWLGEDLERMLVTVGELTRVGR